MSWSRSFPRSNSSFLLLRGKASQSSVLRLRKERFLVDAGIGTPKIAMQDELTGRPIKRATRFEKKVGSQNVVAGQSLIKKGILERLFIHLVTGDSKRKERAAARFHYLVGGSTDVADGEPLMNPQRFRQKRAWKELIKIWRTKKKVKGRILAKKRGGYAVAIAGFITLIPFKMAKKGFFRTKKRFAKKRTEIRINTRYVIYSINPKRRKIVISYEHK
nr:ribosomal protein S1 [Ecdeiocolea monostachya]